MDLEEIAAINATTLEEIRRAPSPVSYKTHPYHGYYMVEIFECPPFVMFTNNDCPRAQDILYHRHFEPTSMKLWCRLACVATGIVDIGAHVGIYALAAAALRSDVPIHAFEPNPHAFARLRVHRKINNFDNILEYYIAIADKPGTGGFSWINRLGHPISSGGALYWDPERGDDDERALAIMMPLDMLPAYNDVGKRGLIKIDVEGSEHVAFKGMPNTLALRPDIILETFEETSATYINSVMLPLGYRVYLIYEDSGELTPQDRLYPRKKTDKNFNQFLTVKPHEEIVALMR